METVEQQEPIEAPGIEEDTREEKDSQRETCNDRLKVNESTSEKESNIANANIENNSSLDEPENEDKVEGDANVDSDDGDPIPSGTGSVSKDCSASDLLGWSEVLPKWHIKLSHRPKGLTPLVRSGIPEPLRGEVWQLLSGAHQSADLMEQYRIFLTQSAPAEQIILRDVHRTYPAHKNFRTGGSSSLLDSLFKVCKAYAVYDEEVGYCQGLSFLVAALLLHMPEEQAFCVFVRIMQHYGLRDLFKDNFDVLYLKFYQLERLLEDNMPDLHQHFTKIGIESFTYASQWFLTVFTAKFPLNAVFYIMDIFLLDGMNTIFQIALALLGSSKQELLALDFEGVLKYFRVQMPKRYRNQDNVQQLINTSSEINLKKLKKYAKNFEVVKQKEKLMENPVARLQRENAKLTENNLRLEQENDDLARDLVASKIQLRAQLDVLEDKVETLNKALIDSLKDGQNYLNTISDIEDEKSRLEVEVNQLKEVCRRELHRAESESARDTTIISDYKKICSQLSKRLDAQLVSIHKFIDSVQDSLRDNEICNNKSCHQLFQSKKEDFLQILKSDTNQQVEKSTKQPCTTAQADLDRSSKPVGAYIRSADSHTTSGEVKIQQLNEHIDELEVELARTKLTLVETECKYQQLIHDFSLGVTIKTSSNHSGSLSEKLDFVKAAVTTRRSPGAAFAKVNKLISDRISNLGGQTAPTAKQKSVSNNSLTINSSGDAQSSPSTTTANNNNTMVDQYQNQC